MEVKGILVGVRRYKFQDKDSGDTVSGAKVCVGVTPDSDDSNVSGFLVHDIAASYSDYDSLALDADSLYAQAVVIDCEIVLKGKYPKLKAVGIRAA